MPEHDWTRTDPRVKLGLRTLLEGKIVVLEGPGHPPVLESLLGEWRAATMEKVTLTREGRTTEILSPSGSSLHLSMLEFLNKGTFSEEKGEAMAEAADADLLVISHLAFEVPQAYRKEAVRMLVMSRVEKIAKAKVISRGITLRPCAVFGVDGPPGSFSARYGDDLARRVSEIGIFVETP